MTGVASSRREHHSPSVVLFHAPRKPVTGRADFAAVRESAVGTDTSAIIGSEYAGARRQHVGRIEPLNLAAAKRCHVSGAVVVAPLVARQGRAVRRIDLASRGVQPRHQCVRRQQGLVIRRAPPVALRCIRNLKPAPRWGSP